MKEAIHIAETMCSVHIDPTKLNMRNIEISGAYYHGAMMALDKMKEKIMPYVTVKERPYVKAELNLCLKDQRSTMFWLSGQPIKYRNHKCDKKGKLIECEAYFVERVTIEREIH